MQELDPSGNPTGGKWEKVSDIIFTPEGKRIEKVVYAPVPTLQHIILTPEDDGGSAQRAALRSDHRPRCRITTSATWAARRSTRSAATSFPCKPKKLVKGKRYFEGRSGWTIAICRS